MQSGGWKCVKCCTFFRQAWWEGGRNASQSCKVRPRSKGIALYVWHQNRMLLKCCIILHRVLEKRVNACIYQLKCRILQSIYYRYNLFKHQLKGGSNNSEIGICALSEVYFWKFVREHSGLCDRTNFQKDAFESVQITFQNSRTLKTEFLEPPLIQNRKY